MRIPSQRYATQPEQHLHSPLGDQRERGVRCICGVVTFNICGSCDTHCSDVPAVVPA